MSYRCVSRIVDTNQITNSQIRSSPLRRIRYIPCLPTGIFCVASLGGCNHAEYKSHLTRTSYRSDTTGYRSDTTGQHLVTWPLLSGRNLLDPLAAPNCEFVSTEISASDR